MTTCQEWLPDVDMGMEGFIGDKRCNAKMIFSLERRMWYCPDCGNQVRVPKEQQSLNEYTRKS
jgi:predicted RNA-binding Zn-ribbon protein involved in translation (DUF1610 family)